MAPARIFTIGHSTRPFEEFAELLKREGVTHLADVRSFPSSRRYPHFNKALLVPALAAKGIAYTHFPALGGRRAARKDSRNTAWKNSGFRGYADYMETTPFSEGLDSLRLAAPAAPTAIMCAEAVPWRCHRSMISDALVAGGDEVMHILDSGLKPHRLTSFGRVENGAVRYDTAPDLDLFG
ncbi:MAG: DUF488 domain-containing protein [Gemmatimonadota bacterium]|nr:DUF488 domain-containing protein [Gemmatimonadota bacterium]